MKQLFNKIPVFKYLALALLIGVVAPVAAGAGQAVRFEAGHEASHEAGLVDIVIHTGQAALPFHVEVARSEAERSRGLMFRSSLPLRGGMIFIYKSPDILAMWMKNTLIPLDMLFIDQTGRIVNIVKNTTPQSLDVIRSAGPVLAVLEIAGGASDQLGIKAGDSVSSGFFSEK
jgi:uncharacterized membrane protein (UPF0127 family)